MFASITNAARLATQQRRTIQTSTSSSNFIGDLTGVLAQRQPCFTVSPADVDVLSSPQQFYNTLLVRNIVHLDASADIIFLLFFRKRSVMHVEEYLYLLYTSARKTLN